MPTPDKDTIVRRLQKFHLEAQNFEKQSSKAFRSADFEIWRSEVASWLGKGSPYTEEQHDDFRSVSFTPISYYSSSGYDQQEERWRDGLKMAKHLISRAIENLEQDWEPPMERAASATNSTAATNPTIIINNQNIQLNSLTVRQVLEEVARQIGEKDQAEGRSFMERIGNWAKDDGLKALLETGWTAALKYVSGS